MRATLAVLKAMADGNRLRVVAALLEHKELCVCYLTEMLGITMASVSRHMSILLAAGVVASRKDGRWVYYRIDQGLCATLRKWLKSSCLGDQQMEQDRQAIGKIRERRCVVPARKT